MRARDGGRTGAWGDSDVSTRAPEPEATVYVALQDPAQAKLHGHDHSGSDAASVWTRGSIAIPMTYLCAGLLLSLPRAHIEYFPRTLDATDAQLSTVLVVRSLPWAIKVLFGLLPDNLPMGHRRFKPYILLGYALSSGFHLALAVLADRLTVSTFALLLLGAMVGIVMADVMSDALVANRVLTGREAAPGHVQGVVYMCRYLSEMVGYWGGAVLSNRNHWGFGLSMREVFALLAVLPLVSVVPCVWHLDEPPVGHVASWRTQREQLWIMLQRRATWQPLAFLTLFNGLLVHNSAWGNYLSVAYRFDAFQYGAMSAIGATVTFFAIFLYRNWIMHRFPDPWRHVFRLTGLVVAVFSVMNVLLVFQVNDTLGLPPFWFAVGDSAVISFAKGFQQLPLAFMLVNVCPENQEGVAYALLTSMTNVSHEFAHTISNILLQLWPVELPDLRRGDFSGVWKLTVLTAMISLIPLCFLNRLLPRGRSEQEAMMNDLSPRHARIALVLYFVGFVWVVTLSLLAVMQPCNVFVGGHGCPPS